MAEQGGNVVDSQAKRRKADTGEAMAVQEGALFCIGNPLLDISTEVDGAYLLKYDLKDNDAILAEEKHLPIYKDLVDNYTVEYMAGGAGQNAIRVAQWMLNSKKRFIATYIGCIGDDEFGKKLNEVATKDGVKVHYLKNKEHPTGTCAVLINSKVRSLVANLGSANHYTYNHLASPENWALVEKANIFYIAGFFLTVSPESIMSIAKHALEKNKLLVLNLSAPFIPMAFKDALLEVLPYVDILVGNELEGAAVSDSLGYGTKDLEEVAKRLAAHSKENKNRERIVIITQGPGDVIVYRNGEVTKYPILPIKEEDIVDTNGAGDAFVGGLLSQLVQGQPFDRCMEGANFTAHTVIMQSGCTFPSECGFV